MTTTLSSDPSPDTLYTLRPLRLGLVLGLALVTVNCGLCERVDDRNDPTQNAASFAERIPASADIAVFAPDWRAVRDAATILDKNVSGLPFSLSSVLSELKASTGLDVTNPTELAKQGVLVDRGLAAVVIDEQTVAMFAVDKPKSFEGAITQVAKTRWRADEKVIEKDIKVGDRTFTMKALVRKQAQKDSQGNVPLTAQNVAFAWVMVDGLVLLFPTSELSKNTKDPEIAFRPLLEAGTAGKDAISKHADYVQLEPWMSQGAQIFGIANLSNLLNRGAANSTNPENTARLKTLSATMRTLGVKFNTTDKGASLKFKAISPPESLAKLQKAFKSTGSISDWTVAFDQNAQLVMKFNLDPQEGIPEFASWLAGENTGDAIGKRLNINLREDLLPALDGNVILAVADLNQRTIAGAMRGSIMPLFKRGDITATFGIKDRAKLLSTLDPIQQSSFGMFTRKDQGDLAVYTIGPPNLTGDPQKQGKPFVTFVISEKTMTAFSGAVPTERGMKIAALQGSGGQGRLHSNANAKRLLTTKDHSGIALDLGAIGAQFAQGPKGPAVGPGAILSSLSTFTMDIHVGDTGPLVDISLDFADPNAPKPKASPQPTSPTPRPMNPNQPVEKTPEAPLENTNAPKPKP